VFYDYECLIYHGVVMGYADFYTALFKDDTVDEDVVLRNLRKNTA